MNEGNVMERQLPAEQAQTIDHLRSVCPDAEMVGAHPGERLPLLIYLGPRLSGVEHAVVYADGSFATAHLGRRHPARPTPQEDPDE